MSTRNSSRADMRYLRRVPWSNLCLTSSSKHFPCFTQVPPPEFTTQSAQADVHDASAPISILLLSVPSLPYILPPPVFSPQKGTVTAGTETISLQHSGSNTPLVWSSLSSLSKVAGENEKDLHVSLAPLGTADSNGPSVNNSGGTIVQERRSCAGQRPGEVQEGAQAGVCRP